MNEQLFHVLPTINVPESGVKHKDGIYVTSPIIPAMPFMYWPSNKPCEPVNMYFLDIAHQLTGDSLKTYAGRLSHLIRYCGTKSISIERLGNADIFELSKQLQAEKKRSDPSQRARNNNTVCDILQRSIKFLLWYQENFILLLSTPLIGERNVSPQITVKLIRNDKHRSKNKYVSNYYTHPAMPGSESLEPKAPISTGIIEDIKRTINRQSLPDSFSARFIQRYRNSTGVLAARLEYLRARRQFLLWMMVRTGLRASELVEMRVEDHVKILTTLTLKIPTKKRRKIVAPVRSFPIRLDAAAVVHRYLIARTAFCDRLQSAGFETNPGSSFFLTENGEPIKKTSLEKDFERLATNSGYRDVQTCLSMFRHRFITLEVVAHLNEFIENSGKTRQMMTDVDYESILKRVTAKTGHGTVASLWRYIDLAWNELRVWGTSDKALARIDAADQFFTEILDLQHDIEISSQRQPNKMINLKNIADRLGKILATAKEDIENDRLHGKHS